MQFAFLINWPYHKIQMLGGKSHIGWKGKMKFLDSYDAPAA